MDPSPAVNSVASNSQTLNESYSPEIRARSPEIVLIVLLSLGMMSLPVADLVCRWFIKHELPGTITFVKHMTLWLGFAGALLATANGKHLGLASGNLLRPGRLRDAVLTLCGAVAAVSCLFFAYASYFFIQDNRSGAAMITEHIPEWWSELMVPIVLLLIAWRMVWHSPGWRGRAITAAACLLVGAVFHFGGASTSHLFLPLLVFLVIAFVLGAPLFAMMAGLAMLLYFHADDGGPIKSVSSDVFRLLQNNDLPAIPLLTMAGYVLAAGSAPSRMVRAYNSIFGWMPGGLGLMAISVCAIFTSFTGGSGVTIIALGGLIAPLLIKDGFPEGFSLGLVTAAGSLGLLFPPSLPVVLYATATADASAAAGVAPASPEKLFVAGFVPGVLLILVVAAYAIKKGIQVKAQRQPFHGKEVLHALWQAKFDLGLPLIVVLTKQLGIGTILQAAAIGACYAILVELIVFRDIHPWREMPKVLVESAMLVGAVVILLGAAFALHGYLVIEQIPEHLVDFLEAHIHSQWAFLLALNAMLLVLGSVFEIYAAIIVLAPLVVPAGIKFGVDPVHLGVVFLANLELGFLFPPMGLNLLLSASRFNKPLPYLYKHALPFLLILAGGVLVITYVPALTTGVAHLFAPR